MRLKDYSWDKTFTIKAEAVFVDGSMTRKIPTLEIQGLCPESLVDGILTMDVDVVFALIQELQEGLRKKRGLYE